MENKLSFKDKYFEIKAADHLLGEVTYLLAKDLADAHKKISEIDLDLIEQQLLFRLFRKRFFFLENPALELSDIAEENGYSFSISREDRITCFHEALLRVFLSGIQNDTDGFLRWQIITVTSDLIEIKDKEAREKS